MARRQSMLKVSFLLFLGTCNFGKGYDNITLQTKSDTSSDSDTSEYPCLRNHLHQDAQKTCFDETLTALNRQLPKMLEFTASRGNPFENLKLSLRDINLNMRENYAKMIENTGKNTFPLLVATDGEPDFFGVGGVWKLYLKDGTMKRIVPVSAEFEFYKALSHMVLGVFSIVAPYFRNPRSINWQPALRTFQQRVGEIQFLLQTGESGLPYADRDRAMRLTSRVNEYINMVLKKNAVFPEEFFQFGQSIAPMIEEAMERAASAHAEGSIPGLTKLKAELGDEEWRKVYVIIPTVWPVSLFNIRLQALEKVMPFDQIKAQVVIIEGASSEAAAKTTLGRIISDRVIAQMLWGRSDNEAFKDHAFSLSTRRDLLSTIASQALNKECSKLNNNPDIKPKCPFAGRQTTTNSLLHEASTEELYATMLRS